jgi:hypothetical protein
LIFIITVICIVIYKYYKPKDDNKIQIEEPGNRLSFRSGTELLDCSAICKHFGGGGHTQAAGLNVKAHIFRQMKVTKPVKYNLQKKITLLLNFILNFRYFKLSLYGAKNLSKYPKYNFSLQL